MSMKEIADWALDIANQHGATYCDVRIVDDRQRALATKNGKIAHAADSEVLGCGYSRPGEPGVGILFDRRAQPRDAGSESSRSCGYCASVRACAGAADSPGCGRAGHS